MPVEELGSVVTEALPLKKVTGCAEAETPNKRVGRRIPRLAYQCERPLSLREKDSGFINKLKGC
jgi:hypothetical protein